LRVARAVQCPTVVLPPIFIVMLAVTYSLSLFATVKLLDFYNTKNSVAVAIAAGIALALVGGVMPLFPSVGLLCLFVFYYDLGLGRGLCAMILMMIITMIVGNIVIDMASSVDATEASTLAAVAAAGAGAGVWIRRRRRTELPTARVVAHAPTPAPPPLECPPLPEPPPLTRGPLPDEPRFLA
jgi:hypothetical protein